MAKTFADYINVGMEHGSFDMPGLGQFMRRLVDGEPTNSGHHTSTVILEAPVDGGSEEAVRVNAWQFQQIPARGVHGFLLCHVESPGAGKAFVESCRYPFSTIGVGNNLDVGRRGADGQASAATIWGISPDEYLEKSDPWPLNPDGEIMLDLKLENKSALLNMELTTRVPGIVFAESGPGDMSVAFGYQVAVRDSHAPEFLEARGRVFAACKASGLRFLEGITTENPAQKIDEGVRIAPAGGPRGEEAVTVARAHAKRTMPV